MILILILKHKKILIANVIEIEDVTWVSFFNILIEIITRETYKFEI